MNNTETTNPTLSKIRSRLVRGLSISAGALGLALAFSTIFAASQTTLMSEAEACRDCPFPKPLAKLHWLLPGGLSEVMVEEINMGHGRQMSVVRLIDRATGALLAIGNLEHNKGRKRIRVELHDERGGMMEAQVYYTNVSRTKVQIKITCVKCSVREDYLN